MMIYLYGSDAVNPAVKPVAEAYDRVQAVVSQHKAKVTDYDSMHHPPMARASQVGCKQLRFDTAAYTILKLFDQGAAPDQARGGC